MHALALTQAIMCKSLGFMDLGITLQLDEPVMRKVYFNPQLLTLALLLAMVVLLKTKENPNLATNK